MEYAVSSAIVSDCTFCASFVYSVTALTAPGFGAAATTAAAAPGFGFSSATTGKTCTRPVDTTKPRIAVDY